jgi:hypothetical protein
MSESCYAFLFPRWAGSVALGFFPWGWALLRSVPSDAPACPRAHSVCGQSMAAQYGYPTHTARCALLYLHTAAVPSSPSFLSLSGVVCALSLSLSVLCLFTCFPLRSSLSATMRRVIGMGYSQGRRGSPRSCTGLDEALSLRSRLFGGVCGENAVSERRTCPRMGGCSMRAYPMHPHSPAFHFISLSAGGYRRGLAPGRPWTALGRDERPMDTPASRRYA